MVTLFPTTGMMGTSSPFSSLVRRSDQVLTKPAERLLNVLGFVLIRVGLRLGEGVMPSHLVAARQS